MRRPRTASACVLAVLTSSTVAACGNQAKPQAGSASLERSKPAGRGVVDDPRTKHIGCLRQHGLIVVERGTSDLLIGIGTQQVAATFAPTPGAAQEEQISGHVQGAEVIGSALLYPGSAPDPQLQTIEDCLAQGVSG